MVKNIVLLSLLFAILALPLNISAQTTEYSKNSDIVELRKAPIAETNQERRLQAQENKEVMQQRVAEFRAQIAEIRDVQKQRIVESIAEKITNANARLTAKMSQALGKLTAILIRVESSAETLSISGINTTILLQAIVTAESAIDDAKTAVAEQAEKEYSANITDDTTLRATIGAMVSAFRQDMSSTHQAVIAAKQAVQNAISEARQLNGSTQATNSANIN